MTDITPSRYAHLLRHAMRLEDVITLAQSFVSHAATIDMAILAIEEGSTGYLVQDDKVEMDWLDKYREENEE